MSHGPGKKDDSEKIRVELLPAGALLEVAKVLTFGASKYGANNWQNVRPIARYYAAALRHLFARIRGQRFDPETGFHHLAHAACCILFMLSIEIGCDPAGALEDEDRDKKSAAWRAAFEAPTQEPPPPMLPIDCTFRTIPHPDHASGAV